MLDLYKVKSFSENFEGGNLAGVILDAQSISENSMQSVAKLVGASESAFVLPSSNADLCIRWFTPNTEVGMCVHATIAALGVLREHHKLSSDTVRIETKNAELLAEFRKDGIFIKIPGYYKLPVIPDVSEILPLLPLDPTQLMRRPGIVEIFSDRELLIEVSSLNELRKLEPKQESYSQICNILGVTGITIFTRETIDLKNQIHTREFAPLYGYLEDPLCGMAAGAISTYLMNEKKLRIEQGHFCDTSGVIKVEAGVDGEIWVGGSYHLLGNELIDTTAISEDHEPLINYSP
jgi:PhzF family phenazine biosynthesis protein